MQGKKTQPLRQKNPAPLPGLGLRSGEIQIANQSTVMLLDHREKFRCSIGEISSKQQK